MSRHDDIFAPARPSRARLYRNPDRGIILGVCAGVADYFGISLTLVRVVMALGLVFFSVPTLLGYLGTAWLLPAQPRDLYRDAADAAFWRQARIRPIETVGALRHKFRELERKLRAVEAHATSRAFDLGREIDSLKG
ncbi:MAG: envelope stress response membrane protein PspC [Alphaproteobacteria bacterium]